MGRRVLITGAEQRAGIAACRGLALDGFTVGAVADSTPAPGLRSRAVHERFAPGPPASRPLEFVAHLTRILASGEPYRLLMAGTDDALWSVSRHRAALGDLVRLGLPPHEVVERAFDRTVLARAAADVGLDSAPSEVCSGTQEVLRSARAFGLPVMLKPVRTIVETPDGLRRFGSVRVDDESTLGRALSCLRSPVIVQRYERGPVVSFAGVIGDGALVGTAFSRYERTWPVDAGSAAYSVTVDPPEGLASAVEALLARIGWEGLFELEMIQRPDGSLVPIDLNPRPYGSMALAVAAGANLPALWARWVLGERPAPAHARAGVRYRWEDGDLRNGVRQLRRGHLRAALAAGRPRRGTIHPYFRWGDPAPFAARVLEIVWDATRRRTGHRAHKGSPSTRREKFHPGVRGAAAAPLLPLGNALTHGMAGMLTAVAAALAVLLGGAHLTGATAAKYRAGEAFARTTGSLVAQKPVPDDEDEHEPDVSETDPVAAAKARYAAVRAAGGGTATATKPADAGATGYEVEIRRPDGRLVEAVLDTGFEVIAIENEERRP